MLLTLRKNEHFTLPRWTILLYRYGLFEVQQILQINLIKLFESCRTSGALDFALAEFWVPFYKKQQLSLVSIKQHNLRQAVRVKGWTTADMASLSCPLGRKIHWIKNLAIKTASIFEMIIK